MTDNPAAPATTDGGDLPVYTEPPPHPTESNIARHAWDELNRAGLFTADGDFYGGMTGRAVMDLVDVLVEQGHSGTSAAVVTDLFRRLVAFEPIGSLTDDPDEWCEVADGLWQSCRHSEAFSRDNGQTYRLNSDRDTVRVSQPREAKPRTLPKNKDERRSDECR